jgi:sulfate adenylyltransferase
MRLSYGNKIINQFITNSKLKKLTDLNKKNIINLDKDDYINLINICTGLYSPITGFCDYKTYCSIINKNKFNNTTDWTIPILLESTININSSSKKNFFKLKYNKKIVGLIKANSKFKINKNIFNQSVFGTNSNSHPGVKIINKKKNSFIGGKIFMLKKCIPKNKYYTTPKKLRFYIKHNQICSSSAFTTRNICHTGHFFIHQYILKKINNLFIIFIQSSKNKYETKTVFETYEIIKKKFNLKKKIKFISIYMPFFFAGPKEAFLQAVIVKNLGINSMIVGRDHAGVKNFYNKYDSQKIFQKYKNLSLKIFKTKEPRICKSCRKVKFENNRKICNFCFKNSKFSGIDGKFVKKKLIQKNYTALEGLLDPLVISYFKKKKVFKNVA